MKTLLLSFSAALMLISVPTFAKDCVDDIAASLTCMNPDPGADVRFYITELQTCNAGKLTVDSRSILGLHVRSQNSIEDIHDIYEDKIAIDYMEKRTMIDPKDRVDYLSFLLPSSVKMQDGDLSIEMSITTKTAPDYRDALSRHFKGTFKILKADGSVKKSGRLYCFVIR